MSVQALYNEFSKIATIHNVDGILLVRTEQWVALGIIAGQNQLKFVDGTEVSSEELHEMLHI